MSHVCGVTWRGGPQSVCMMCMWYVCRVYILFVCIFCVCKLLCGSDAFCPDPGLKTLHLVKLFITDSV